MFKNKKLFFIKRNIVLIIIIFLIFNFFSFLRIDFVNAQAVGVQDSPLTAKTTEGQTKRTAWDKFVDAMKTAGSKAFGSALTSALNTIAYDTATWIGSGGEGQKPTFITEGWDSYLTNVVDNAAGSFIEGIGNNSWMKFNICEPDLAVKLNITLGLAQYKKPSEPKCSFSRIKENWQNEIDKWRDMERDDYLKDFQDMFTPASNDVGAALTLNTGMLEAMRDSSTAYEKDRQETGGWLDIRNVGGLRESYPGAAKAQEEMARTGFMNNLAQFTGDALIDAGNIFLNQLAITAFQAQLKKLLNNPESYTISYDGDYGIGELGDAVRQASSGGITAMKDRLKNIVEPNFTVRGDYDIIAELSVCPDPANAGPTNCVINDKFSQAITNKLTVAESIEQGYLNPGGIFGFQNKVEPLYTEGYPYRSMIILRKFRVLPVGWEVAAQYIYENASDKTYSLGDLVGCFDAYDGYKGNLDENWCRGLVDPNWVLKAPLNYCRRQGAGPEITSSIVAGEGQSSQLMISRNENYCADEQSCIDENDDGSCRFYGYCVAEKRKWRFDGNSCKPRFNSCQTFSSPEGDTISYLKNTLDYSVCSADNVGCQAYCEDYDYISKQWSCDENTDNKVYFDKDIEECDQESEGCHEFIRTKSGLGVNLLVNSSFEHDVVGSVWEGLSEQLIGGYDGTKSLKLTNNIDKYIEVGPSEYSIIGRAYTLSFYAKDCGTFGEFGLGTNLESKTMPLSTGSNWARYTATYVYPEYYIDNKVRLIIRNFGESCNIDAIKLENNKVATTYTDYRDTGLVYEKLLPEYMENACYLSSSDYRLAGDVPEECNNFARKCNQDEVGCEMFTSVRDKTSIPAQVVEDNYCPGECSGYDEYIQSDTTFDSLRSAYFIPSTAKTCTAEAAGCDEFTNLDEVARGGEGIEYYTYLRQCVKSNDSSCAEFYTWEGSDEAGYQLKVFKLKSEANEPFVTEEDLSMCNVSIYNLSSGDPSYNPDCREFYSKSGDISYHLYTRTVSCSDDCHSYRRTAVNNDPEIADQAGCSSAGGAWVDGACAICKNNGRWDTTQKACFYDAIPGEGISCQATQNGCRKYVGNFGNNMKNVLSYYFEGSAQGWSGSGSTNADLSGESLSVGGESLYASGGDNSIFATVGNLVQAGKSYSLNFMVKPGAATKITSIILVNGLSEKDVFASVDLSNDWQFYKVNLANLNNRVDANEKLVITANGDFYIDDIELIEVNDQYYLIKDSWSTPESCDQDLSGNPSPLHMLGCAEYRDRDNVQYYLHSFNNLCQESAVGCELLIDSNNFSDYKAKIFNEGDISEIDVPADKFVYAVYDREKECSWADKGCQKLGKSYEYEGDSLYNDEYYLNNPDKYNQILCTEEAVGCQAWSSGASISYFKDPSDQVCEWRLAFQGDWGWYKKKITRCDNNKDGSGEGNVCQSGKDCQESIECKLESDDKPCFVRANKTFGTGNEKIYQPSIDDDNVNWVGICAAEDSGCTEYIDPVSSFSTNILANSDFAIDNEAPSGSADLWNDQTVQLDPNTLYVLSVEGDNGITITSSALVFYELEQDNKLSSASLGTITVSASDNERKNKLFYTSNSATSRPVAISVNNFNKDNGSKVSLRAVVLDYQLAQDLDKTGCNGLVDFEDGCVLFNERSYSGKNLNKSIWDSYLTIDDENGVSPSVGEEINRDANIVLKVRPDRECDKWMACTAETTGIVDGKEAPVCIDVGLCDRIDDNGNCARFVDNRKESETYDPWNNNGNEFLNRSGYSKVGLEYNPERSLSVWPNNLYPFGFMESKGEVVSITNNGFEFAKDKDKQEYDSSKGEMKTNGDYGDYGDFDVPEYWEIINGCNKECLPEVVDDPVEAAKEDICFAESDFSCEIYAPEGKNFLKLLANNFGRTKIASTKSTVLPSQDYVFSTFIDTSKLTAGRAKVTVNQYNDAGGKIKDDSLILESMKKWEFKMKKFKTDPSTKNIDIELYTAESAESDAPYGYAYFDDIKIRPALEINDLTPDINTDDNYWDVGQTCRLYPKSDSLSCDYYEGSAGVYDKGVRYKGWFGHCLEYDRYPGSSKTCLLWWPAPHTTNRVNEWCGDNKVTGDEDCECVSDLISNPANVVLNCSLWGIDSNSVWGTNIGHQYNCTNCTFTEGWCGDNVLQKNMGEECDWNEITVDSSHKNEGPNLDKNANNGYSENFSCAYAPSEQNDLSPFTRRQDDGDARNWYKDKYRDEKGKYLYSKTGDLGCHQSGTTNQCTFDYSTCSEYLGYEGMPNRHTRQQCISLGGEILNKNGDVVINVSNKIISKNISKDDNNDGVDDYYPYFCKITNTLGLTFIDDPNQNVCGLNYSGWNDFMNLNTLTEWSSGALRKCDGFTSCSSWALNPGMALVCDAFDTGDWTEGDYGVVDGCDQCGNGYMAPVYNWRNATLHCGLYKDGGCEEKLGTKTGSCNDSDKWCCSIPTAIGCY